jgi:hypothetical protein
VLLGLTRLSLGCRREGHRIVCGGRWPSFRIRTNEIASHVTRRIERAALRRLSTCEFVAWLRAATIFYVSSDSDVQPSRSEGARHVARGAFPAQDDVGVAHILEEQRLPVGLVKGLDRGWARRV